MLFGHPQRWTRLYAAHQRRQVTAPHPCRRLQMCVSGGPWKSQQRKGVFRVFGRRAEVPYPPRPRRALLSSTSSRSFVALFFSRSFASFSSSLQRLWLDWS
jgi:hypothetical protein